MPPPVFVLSYNEAMLRLDGKGAGFIKEAMEKVGTDTEDRHTLLQRMGTKHGLRDQFADDGDEDGDDDEPDEIESDDDEAES